jgi:hypothetical protein
MKTAKCRQSDFGFHLLELRSLETTSGLIGDASPLAG